MVRVTNPPAVPAPFPEVPGLYRAPGNFGKGTVPESAGFGNFGNFGKAGESPHRWRIVCALLTDPKREARRLARLLDRWPATVRVHRILATASASRFFPGSSVEGHSSPGLALDTEHP